MAQQELFVRGLTRRKTRVQDPVANQAGAGGNYLGGTLSPPTGTSGGTVSSFGGTAAKIDLADGPTRRIFSNKSATVVVLPDYPIILQKAGGLSAAGTASGLYFRVPRNMTVWGVTASVGTIPTGGTGVAVDVISAVSPTAAGTSIFLDATRKPIIAATTDASPMPAFVQTGGSAGNPGSAGANGTVALGLGSAGNASYYATSGSFLRVEILGVGGTVAGSDLVVQIYGF